MNLPTISVVIPTFNEAARIEPLIASLNFLPGPAREIIISDGGSDDETVKIAHQNGALVVQEARGRGAQLNAGASITGGEILWFLHADALVHRRSLEYLRKCAADSRICGGNFRLRFENTTWSAHFFARIARQQRRAGIYYGDSGIWTRREIFVELNGFKSWPLFEDYDFARRLEFYARFRGRQTALAPYPITVSARRFERQPLRVLRQWLWLQILFSCGVPPEKLAALYRRTK